MSEEKKDYKISVAKSNKKSKKAVDTFKIRKSGNSSIITVPDAVKEELNVKDGDYIQYVTIKNEENEPIVILNKTESKEKNDHEIADEVKEAFENSMEKYDDIITALAEL